MRRSPPATWTLLPRASLRTRSGTCPARPPSPETYAGWAAIRDAFILKLLRLSEGTFRAELLDIAVGASYVVAVQHATAHARGKVLDLTGCQLMRIESGLIQQVRGHYSDEASLDNFWRD